MTQLPFSPAESDHALAGRERLRRADRLLVGRAGGDEDAVWRSGTTDQVREAREGPPEQALPETGGLKRW